MTIREKTEAAAPAEKQNRYPLAIDVYARVMAAILMLLGLRHWAIIIGVMPGETGSFEEMTLTWQLATVHLAVIDLVAAVGLWMRVAWGNVVWVWAAVTAVAMHTVFAETFGFDYGIIALHVFGLLGMGILLFLARRAAHS
ncbi:MAG: hypothetical protein J0H63_13195 [Rhizobiales bacterium]|nr:hypothetical protein [Hyphomicrobiales bacterium]MBN9011026.1 hypothetical protein [Hyphomicrobiales bacterium]